MEVPSEGKKPLKMAMAQANDAGDALPRSGTLEEIFLAQESPLLVYAYRLTGDDEVAQDIVQEVFMKLHQRFGEVRQPRPWLYRTVHNLAMNHHRANRKIVPLESESETHAPKLAEDSEPLPDEYIQRMEAIGRTRLALESLETRSRELIRLKFEEGLSYKEIGDRLGISVGNVGYILHHSLKTLSKELRKSGVAP